MQHRVLLLAACALFSGMARAQQFVSGKNEPGSFPVVAMAKATAIYVDEQDHWLVERTAELLQDDIGRVTGQRPQIVHSLPAGARYLVILGSLDSSRIVQEWAQKGKIGVNDLRGKWEAWSIQFATHPAQGIGSALVIAGSDRRGTAYGAFELSRQMGVSPWYWWADVPVKQKAEVWVRKGSWGHGSPAVKYRGIFINDEAPAFSGWTKEKFGGVNHQVYEKMFELLLRLKGNYLWPAMWGNAFNDDDKLDPVLADKYGIVMGTSHHEPMLRAQQEWKRYGSGPWNYETNGDTLRAFWRRGIEHMGTHESIVTIGMRGDGDMPMTKGSNVELLEKIVKDQRAIISEVTGKPASETPQLWALYKEVQDYYDKGMRVPDDVTLLLCDDNWGDIRRLPQPGSAPRSGGYGIYYHFDYVGGPRNYKWLNTNPIPRVWEQMHLALEHGVDRIWIVNVGDLKPMEYPISFFLDYAWDPAQWPAERLPEYARQWAAEQFGPAHAPAIADLLTKYTKYNGRRKPELLSPDTYSQENYDEAGRIVREYDRLVRRADSIEKMLPVPYRDAWFELVGFPIKACANLNALYVTVGKNRLQAAHGDPAANNTARLARSLYERDSLLSYAYNKELAGGKWDHMMDQTHIGYTFWQEPKRNRMPEVHTVDSQQTRGATLADSTVIRTSVRTRPRTETLQRDQQPPRKTPDKMSGSPVFAETDGYVSIEAEHYARAVGSKGISWVRIPDLGRTLSAMEASPVTATAQTPGGNSPHLEYRFYSFDTGTVKVHAYFSPTLDIAGNGQLLCAISLDNDPPQVVNLSEGSRERGVWDKWVSDNIIIKTSEHRIARPGTHTLKYWMIDPAVVLQKIVIDLGGERPSYLGPPESRRR